MELDNPDEIVIDDDEDFDGEEGGTVDAIDESVAALHAIAHEIVFDDAEENIVPPPLPDEDEGPL